MAGWLHLQLLWYLFLVLDTLKGVFIFISFTLIQRVRQDVRRELSRFSTEGKGSRKRTTEKRNEEELETRRMGGGDGNRRDSAGIGDTGNVKGLEIRGSVKEADTKDDTKSAERGENEKTEEVWDSVDMTARGKVEGVRD